MSDVPAPRRVVVLVHGTRMSRAQWNQYPPLLPDVELITVDLPGHGDRAGAEFTAEAALAVIDEAMGRAGAVRADDRGQEPAVVLAGHSLGGYLAMMWAAEHPGRAGALVLIGASADPRGPLTGVYRGFARVLPHVGPERMARVANAVIRAVGGGRSEEAAPLPDGAAYAALPAAWDLVMERGRPGLLARVDCPVLLVNGQYDQMRVHARRFAQCCRQPLVLVVSRASHLLPLSHPEAVVEVLRTALAVARSPRERQG